MKQEVIGIMKEKKTFYTRYFIMCCMNKQIKQIEAAMKEHTGKLPTVKVITHLAKKYPYVSIF